MERNCLVFSDVHGDREAMRRIKKAAEHFSSERILSAGDLCPDPYDPLFFSIEGVRGNCDRYYEYGTLPFPPLVYTTEIYGRKVTLTHGHTPVDIPGDTDVLITGHTHIPVMKRKGKLYLLNPGSASLPRSSEGAAFALFTPSFLALFALDDFREISILSFSSSYRD